MRPALERLGKVRRQQLTTFAARLRKDKRLVPAPRQVQVLGLKPANITAMKAGAWSTPLAPLSPLEVAAADLTKYLAKLHPSQVETNDAVRTAAKAIILLATPPK